MGLHHLRMRKVEQIILLSEKNKVKFRKIHSGNVDDESLVTMSIKSHIGRCMITKQ